MATRYEEKFVFLEQCGWSHKLNRHAKIVLRKTLGGITRVEYKRMLNYLISKSNSINLLAQQPHCRSTPFAQSRFKALKTPMLATVIAKFNASNLQKHTAWVKATLTQLSYGSNLVTSPPIHSLISLSASCSAHQLVAVKRGTSLAPLPPTHHFCQALQYRFTVHCHFNSTIKHRAFFLGTGR